MTVWWLRYFSSVNLLLICDLVRAVTGVNVQCVVSRQRVRDQYSLLPYVQDQASTCDYSTHLCLVVCPHVPPLPQPVQPVQPHRESAFSNRATRRLAVAPDAGIPAPHPGCVSIRGGTRTRRCDTSSGGGARSARSFKRKRCCGGACGRRLAAALSRVAWRDKIRRIGEKAVRDVVAKKRC